MFVKEAVSAQNKALGLPSFDVRPNSLSESEVRRVEQDTRMGVRKI